MSFCAGFSRAVISPEPGVLLEGYFIERRAEGILDDLMINALALQLDGERVLIISLDLHSVRGRGTDIMRDDISAAVGIPKDHIFIHCNHNHTGPGVRPDHPDPANRRYFETLRPIVVRAAGDALADLRQARIGYGVVGCELTHSRRVLMKDGTIVTNPGVNNPESIWEVGETDHSMNVVRIDREGAETIILINYGVNPDTIGGNMISADCIGFTRSTIEGSIPGVKSIFLNGAHGDVGSQPVFAEPGWFNDTAKDFDDVVRGYGHSRWCGRYMAGSVMKMVDKVNYFEPDKLLARLTVAKVPTNIPAKKELPEARRIHRLHLEGRDSELGYSGMMLTTVVAEAERMIKLEKAPKVFDVAITGIAVGPIAFIGVAAEPFSGLSLALKDTKEWAMVMPVSIVNGYEGIRILPMKEDYEEGGYEARVTVVKAGGTEYVISEAKQLLDELRRN